MVIEFNFTIPNDIYFVQDPDPELHHGASLLALIELGRDKGYELVAATYTNALFVEADNFAKFDIADNGIDAMFTPGPLESKLFQLYDGTLVLAGCDKLVYRAGMPIDQEDIQVLPKALRGFQSE